MSYGVGSVSFTRVRSGAVTAIAVRLVPSHCQIGTSYRGFGISRWVAMLRSCRRPRDLTVFTRVDARHTYVQARGKTWERGVVVDDRAAPAAGGGRRGPRLLAVVARRLLAVVAGAAAHHLARARRHAPVAGRVLLGGAVRALCALLAQVALNPTPLSLL